MLCRGTWSSYRFPGTLFFWRERSLDLTFPQHQSGACGELKFRLPPQAQLPVFLWSPTRLLMTLCHRLLALGGLHASNQNCASSIIWTFSTRVSSRVLVIIDLEWTWWVFAIVVYNIANNIINADLQYETVSDLVDLNLKRLPRKPGCW